ncbi:ImmA/IrrE family metallo-endopeptidase [Mycoplasmopsis opalescens]|uniref:ImmA/IrrE family metallo-endopeptidase n=1 Tax=Mycoplasmopsis opalescens TaxID=114886 RepID=UPI0004A6D27B|nr:hypothetical protein [Mycoplasmopsis opalescens]
MDFKTKPITRAEIRRIAKVFKSWLNLNGVTPFPILLTLEKLCTLIDNFNYSIIEDKEWDKQYEESPSMVCYSENEFNIKIKESVYIKASKYKDGASRMHIAHEISHFILLKNGFVPVDDVVWENNSLPNYESAEWQAKALACEILVDIDSIGIMSTEELMKKNQISRSAAEYITKNLINHSQQ